MENELQNSNINLDSAKKFFVEAIQLAQAYGNNKYSSLMEEVPVERGECVKTILCDEYKGVKLQKFFAKKGTSLKFNNTDDLCRGFIIHDGGVIVKTGDKHMLLPEERHFFYTNGGDFVLLEFIKDTCFYVVSTTK